MVLGDVEVNSTPQPHFLGHMISTCAPPFTICYQVFHLVPGLPEKLALLLHRSAACVFGAIV